MEEYKTTWCKLASRKCDNTCELWEKCPIEKHDIADGEFIDDVITYIKRKEKK